jgi:hypothetical protein
LIRVNFRSAPAVVVAGNVIANTKFGSSRTLAGAATGQEEVNRNQALLFENNAFQRKCMVPSSAKYPHLSNPLAVLNSNWNASSKFLQMFPLGLISIVECIPSCTAQYELISHLIYHLIAGQVPPPPKLGDIPDVSLLEDKAERVFPNEFAILFRKNETGHKLVKYLRRSHRDLKIKWHKTPHEGLTSCFLSVKRIVHFVVWSAMYRIGDI